MRIRASVYARVHHATMPAMTKSLTDNSTTLRSLRKPLCVCDAVSIYTSFDIDTASERRVTKYVSTTKTKISLFTRWQIHLAYRYSNISPCPPLFFCFLWARPLCWALLKTLKTKLCIKQPFKNYLSPKEIPLFKYRLAWPGYKRLGTAPKQKKKSETFEWGDSSAINKIMQNEGRSWRIRTANL